MALIKQEEEHTVKVEGKKPLFVVDSKENKPTNVTEIGSYWESKQTKQETLIGVLLEGLENKDSRLIEFIYEKFSHKTNDEIEAMVINAIDGENTIIVEEKEIEQIEFNLDVVEQNNAEISVENEIKNDLEYKEEDSKGVEEMAILNNKTTEGLQNVAVQAIADNCGALDYSNKHSRYKEVESIVIKMREHFEMFTMDIPKFMQVNEKVQKSGVLEFTGQPDTTEETSNSIKTSENIISMGNNFAMETAYLTIVGTDTKKDNQKLDKTIKMLKLILL